MYKWDKRFIALAEHVAQWSKDPSTKVGAIIVDKNRIVSEGYNGFPTRLPDKEEWLNDRQIKYQYIIHAEINAILYAKTDLVGCTIYTWPLIPCIRCVPIIIQSGIHTVVSIKDTPTRPDGSAYTTTVLDESIKILDAAGLEVVLL